MNSWKGFFNKIVVGMYESIASKIDVTDKLNSITSYGILRSTSKIVRNFFCSFC